uniref:Uncharacterized protein n=1 Tax=Oryza sativa subsp. japonica TaxID=39947 RepID=Q6Z5A6_ORYSJ|nr:hypothetical protein [Oryza sativa Japonica Group]BAD30131.1 hypothetical protein [Oryza sativa Japonica Group]
MTAVVAVAPEHSRRGWCRGRRRRQLPRPPVTDRGQRRWRLPPAMPELPHRLRCLLLWLRSPPSSSSAGAFSSAPSRGCPLHAALSQRCAPAVASLALYYRIREASPPTPFTFSLLLAALASSSFPPLPHPQALRASPTSMHSSAMRSRTPPDGAMEIAEERDPVVTNSLLKLYRSPERGMKSGTEMRKEGGDEDGNGDGAAGGGGGKGAAAAGGVKSNSRAAAAAARVRSNKATAGATWNITYSTSKMLATP